jgi:hypothetical protein
LKYVIAMADSAAPKAERILFVNLLPGLRVVNFWAVLAAADVADRAEGSERQVQAISPIGPGFSSQTTYHAFWQCGHLISRA